MSPRDPDPIGNDLRRERRRRELPSGAACPHCGEDDPLKLEFDEPGGRANDPEGPVIVCSHCHRPRSAAQAGYGVELKADPDRSLLERMINVLRGLALMFEMLAASCKRWADWLTAFVRALDAHFPGWRELPEA
jgi:hypothetical protein